MDTKTTENETNETIKSQENEESYQIPAISFEDSQVDHFIPYSSPSVLNWDTRKVDSNNDLSDIELVRGGGGAAGSSGIELSSELSQKPIDESEYDENDKQENTNSNNDDHDNKDTTINETIPLEKYESTLKTLANIDITATEIHIDSTTNENIDNNNQSEAIEEQNEMGNVVVVEEMKHDQSEETKQQSLSDLINQIELNIPESNDEYSNSNLNEQTSNMIIETIQKDKLPSTNEKQFSKPKLETMSSQSSNTSSSDSTSYKAINTQNTTNNKLNNNQENGKTYILNERKLIDSKTNDRFKLLSAVSNDIDIDFYNIDENIETNKRKNDVFDDEQRQSHSSNDDCATQSTGQDAVTTIKDSEDQITQPRTSNFNTKNSEINDNKFTSNMLNLSSQSSSSSSSNATSLDSLAKRVQDLIGPIKLDANKDQLKPTASSTTAPAASSTSLYAQIIQNNGKLPSSYVFKKQFDHHTIQKDLDYITNSLKRASSISTNASTEDYDKPATSNNQPTSNINETKPNKELGTRKSVKSSLDFETPKVKLDLLSTNTNAKSFGLTTTSGRDLLYETPMRNSTYIPQQTKQHFQPSNNTTSNSYSIYNNNVMYSTTPLMQQTDKLTTHVETPASYNMLFGKQNSVDYHSSTMYYDNKGVHGGIYGNKTTTTKTTAANLIDNRDDRDLDYDRVKHTATSPIKFDYTLTETLSKSDYYKTLINDNHTIDMPPPHQQAPSAIESYYKRTTVTKSPTRSAFDDDPDVIKAKHGISVTGASAGVLTTTTTTTIAATSAKYVPLKNQNETFKSDSSMMRSLDTLSYTTNSLYNQQSAHNFNAFDKANSKLMTQLRDAMNRSPLSGSVLNDNNNSLQQKGSSSKFVDLQPHKPNANITPNSTGSGLTTVTSIGPPTGNAVPPGSASIKQLDSTQNSQQTETIESTHTGSDDARGPRFPSHVYGSREDPQSSKMALNNGTKAGGANGVLYEKKNNNNQVKQDTPRSERSEDNSLLDADNLKKMDKNLKKLMKKEDKLKNTQLRNMDNVVCRDYAVAWDINFDDIEQIIANENMANNKNNDSTLNSSNSDLIVTHPYLPLRDVPMNDLVKKLQHEFELDGDMATVTPNMQRYWQLMKQQQQQQNNKENINNEENIKKLEKLFQNPLKTIIQQSTGEERPNQVSNSQSSNKQQERNVESKSVQVMVPSPQEPKQISAAATQTSFIIETKDEKHGSSKRMKKLHQINSINEDNDTDKESANLEQIERHRAKMRAIIRKQKQEHENRCKALEKLAKLERLQAEKLKQMMLMNQSDDQASFLTNSYCQDTTVNTENQNSTTTTLNETSDDDTTIKMHEQIRKLEAKLLSKYKSSKQNLPKSYVQVLNLKNTSVHEPPEGYYVVKEKSGSTSKQVIEKPIVNKNTQMQQQQQRKQTNELHADEDGRVFVTIPGGGGCGGGVGGGSGVGGTVLASNVTNSSIHVSKSAQNIRPQNTAWFQPVTLVSETTREPFRKQQSVQTPFQHHHHHHQQQQQQQQSLPSSLKKSSSTSVPILSQSRSPARERQATRSPVRFADSVTKINPIQQEIQEIKGLKKLSLQEAFEMFNFDFISRSRKRLKEMKLRAEERRHEEEFKRERIELGIDSEANPTASILRRNQLALQHHPLSDNLHLAQRRQMSVEQIKEQTQKVYKNLPEVKERMKKQKAEEDRKRNRIKTSIYKRTIQQRVLARGPNFKLDFKALE